MNHVSDARPLVAPHLIAEINDDLLPVSQAADTAGVTPGHLRTLIRTGRGPAAFHGMAGEILIPRAELAEWLEFRQIAPAPKPAAVKNRRNCEWLCLEPLRTVMPELDAGNLARLANVSTRTAIRWIDAGEIPLYSADRVACALGTHPCLLWGDAWWADGADGAAEAG